MNLLPRPSATSAIVRFGSCAELRRLRAVARESAGRVEQQMRGLVGACPEAVKCLGSQPTFLAQPSAALREWWGTRTASQYRHDACPPCLWKTGLRPSFLHSFCVPVCLAAQACAIGSVGLRLTFAQLGGGASSVQARAHEHLRLALAFPRLMHAQTPP